MTFQYTPKKRSPFEFGVDFFIWFGLVAIWVYVTYHHGRLPDIIAIHFDAVGNANSYGSKDNIFVLPLILTIAIVFLKSVSHFPQYHNYPIHVTQEMAPKLFQISVPMLRYLGLVLLVVFGAITYSIIAGSYDGNPKMSPYFLPILILVILTPVIIGVYRMARIK